MASESFTLLDSTTQAWRSLRIKGALIASNWADGAIIYTVPDGKRLVLKGSLNIKVVTTAADTVRLYSLIVTPPYPTLTLVLTAGTKITTEVGPVVTGFLEDDV